MAAAANKPPPALLAVAAAAIACILLAADAASAAGHQAFVVAGRDRVRDETRELAVVGGTGALREATGYVLWRTAKVWSEIHMALELDVHASLPPPPQEDGAAATE
uniref:Dirigent protein n=1 Tax=Oryza brachyantha TaxID=4533 RepID=J3MSL7_ORYBR